MCLFLLALLRIISLNFFFYQKVGIASIKLRTGDWLSGGGRIEEAWTLGLGTLDSSSVPHCSLVHRPRAY